MGSLAKLYRRPFALLYRMKNLGMISKEDYFKIKSEFDERFNDYVEAQKIKTEKPKDAPLYYPMTVNTPNQLRVFLFPERTLKCF
jgi:DNA-directed RNA polymerase